MRRSGGLRWLVGAALAILASSATDADAIDVCSAEQVTAQDPGCPPGDAPCTITLPLDLIDSPTCRLDFGMRDVRLQDTLDSTGTVSLTTGALAIDPGASIRAPRISIAAQGDVAVRRMAGSQPGLLDVSGFDGGELKVSTLGRFLLDGRIDADAGGAGKYAGSITIEAAAGITAGPGSLLSADAPISDEGSSLSGELDLATPGPILLQGTVTLRGPSAGDEQIGGHIDIQAGDLRLAPDAVLRGGTIDAEIEGDVRIERGSGSRRALIQADGAGSSIGILATGDLWMAGELSTDGSSCERGINFLYLTAEGALTVTADAVLSASGVPDPESDDVCSAYVDLGGDGGLLFEGTLVQLGGGDPEGDAYLYGYGDVTVRGRIRMDGWYQRSFAGSLNVSGDNVIVDSEITAVAGASTLGIERGGYSGNVDIDGIEVFVGGSITTDGTLYGAAGLIAIEGERVTVTAALSTHAHRLNEYPGRVHIDAGALDFRGSIDVGNGGEVTLQGEALDIGGQIVGHTQPSPPEPAFLLEPTVFIGSHCGYGRVTLAGLIDLSAFGCEAGVCAEPWKVEVAAGEVTLAPAAVIENTGRVGGRVAIAGEQLALAGRIDVGGGEADGSVAVSLCAGAEQPACAITAQIEPPVALLNGCLVPTPTSSVPPVASPTPTPSATPLPSATIAAPGCPGDCDGDGVVGSADLMRALGLVNLCHGSAAGCAAAPAPCTAADLDHSAAIGAGELSRIVGALGTICD